MREKDLACFLWSTNAKMRQMSFYRNDCETFFVRRGNNPSLKRKKTWKELESFRQEWFIARFFMTSFFQSGKLWSSRLWTQFKQLRIEAWKSQDFYEYTYMNIWNISYVTSLTSSTSAVAQMFDFYRNSRGFLRRLANNFARLRHGGKQCRAQINKKTKSFFLLQLSNKLVLNTWKLQLSCSLIWRIERVQLLR